MKKLFAIMMSFQLICAPLAMAEDKKEKPQKNVGDQFRENPDAKKSGDYLQMILGIGTSVVGVNALTSCKLGTKSPSILILVAGSAVHIMSELLGGKAHNDYLKKKASDLKMVEEKLKGQGGGGEVQKEALESALANEKEILKFINKRKMWSKLLLAVYAAGIAAAGAELLSVFGNIPAGCTAATGFMANKWTAVGISTAFSFVSGGMVQSLLTGLISYLTAGGAAGTLLLNTPTTRIAFFGVATAIQTTVISSLGKKAKVAKENIEKLEKAIAEFKATSAPTNGIATDTTGVGSGNADSNIDPTTGKPFPFKALPSTPEITRTCAGSNAQGIDISSKACASPLRLQSPKFDANLQVPTLQSFGQGVAHVGNALSAGNLEGAEVQAASLVAQAGRINQIKDNIIKKVNEKLKASGKKPIDIDADTRAQLASMSNAMRSQDPAVSGALGALASGAAALGDDLKGEGDIKESVQEIKAADTNAGAVSTPENGTALDASLGNLEDEFSSVDETAKVGDMLKSDEFEFNQEDVRKDSDTSLFNMLSTRYLLNYPKFFKREDPQSVPAEQKK